MMRHALGGWIVAACLGLAACAPERDFTLEEEVREADFLVDELEGKALDAELAKIIEQDKELGAPLFPILKSKLDCGDTSLEVLYNPYRHAFVVTFGNETSLHEELRSLTVGGAKLFEADKPFAGRDAAFGKTGSATKHGLYKVTKNHPATFPAGEDVSLPLVANVMSAKKAAGKTFTYRPFVHRGWTVKLHVFSDAEQKAIDDHGRRSRRAAAMVKYLARVKLPRGEHPRIDEVRSMLEEKKTAAKAELDAVAKLPHAELAKSLTIEHTPPCLP